MKKLLLILSLLVMLGLTPASQVPTKLFDVQNGNGAVIGANTYPQAIIIPFKDAASKTKLINALATNSGWSSLLSDGITPNPQTAQQAATNAMINILKQIYITEQTKAAAKTAGDTASATATGEVP